MTIPEIVAELQSLTHAFPTEAMESAIEQREAITPELLRMLEESAANLSHFTEDYEYFAHLYAMCLLAEFREPRAYPILVNLFSCDSELWKRLYGDLVNGYFGRVLASVSNGDTRLVEQMIENPALNGYVRAAGLDALLVLVCEGVKTREEVLAYIELLFDGRLEHEPSFIWTGLVLVCRELNLRSLEPRIEKAFDEGLADPFIDTLRGMMGADEFQSNELQSGGVEDYLRAAGNTFIRDALGDAKRIRWWYSLDGPEPDAAPPPVIQHLPDSEHPPLMSTATTREQTQFEIQTPIRNSPKVGRNQPCPCGSGKKYKRCCGG